MMRPSSQETFGARLRRLMTAKNINQSELAERTGIERTQLNRMISGKARPKPDQLGWLASVLGVTLDELMADTELPPEVRRAIDQGREAIERVLRAESERDQAVARATRLEAELTRERTEREHERAEAARARKAAEAAALERQQDAARRAASREVALKAELAKRKQQIRRHVEHVDRLRASQSTVLQQIELLQRQLAQVRADKSSAQLFAGIVGLALGRVVD